MDFVTVCLFMANPNGVVRLNQGVPAFFYLPGHALDIAATDATMMAHMSSDIQARDTLWTCSTTENTLSDLRLATTLAASVTRGNRHRSAACCSSVQHRPTKTTGLSFRLANYAKGSGPASQFAMP